MSVSSQSLTMVLLLGYYVLRKKILLSLPLLFVSYTCLYFVNAVFSTGNYTFCPSFSFYWPFLSGVLKQWSGKRKRKMPFAWFSFLNNGLCFAPKIQETLTCLISIFLFKFSYQLDSFQMLLIPNLFSPSCYYSYTHVQLWILQLLLNLKTEVTEAHLVP